MFGSVRARTAAASVLVAGAGVVAAGFAVHGLLHRSLIADTDRAALHRAEDVAALVEAGTLPARLPIPEDKDNDELLVQVTDRSGRIVSASALMVDAPLMLPGPPPPPGGRRTTSVKGLPPDPHDPFRVVAITTAAPAQGFTVYTATELELVAQSDDALVRLLVRGGPPFLALVALVSWLIADRALRRVEGIRGKVAGITAEALDRRVPEPPGGDEITRLARTMNEMLDRLQLAGERQRRFVADASHELKSPLAAVQAELEVALAHPEQADWPDTATRLLAEDERMERLVADLLFLAQCDDGDFSSLTVPAEVVALDAVVRDETDRLGQRWTVPVDVAVASMTFPPLAASGFFVLRRARFYLASIIDRRLCSTGSVASDGDQSCVCSAIKLASNFFSFGPGLPLMPLKYSASSRTSSPYRSVHKIMPLSRGSSSTARSR